MQIVVAVSALNVDAVLFGAPSVYNTWRPTEPVFSFIFDVMILGNARFRSVKVSTSLVILPIFTFLKDAWYAVFKSNVGAQLLRALAYVNSGLEPIPNEVGDQVCVSNTGVPAILVGSITINIVRPESPAWLVVNE